MTIQQWWWQVSEMTLASLKSRYRKTITGMLWVIANPLLMFGVQSLVFKKFLRLDVPDYYLFLLGGLIPWIFITQTLQMSTPTFVNYTQLMKSFKIHPHVLIYSQILDNLINFLLTFFILLVPTYFIHGMNFTHLLLLPLPLLSLVIAVTAMSSILSTLNVFFRDTNFVLGFLFSILFFLTPIFYPLEFMPREYHWIVTLNPVYHLISPVRDIVYGKFGADFWHHLGLSYLCSLIVSVIAISYWKLKRNDLYARL
ncbi:MAG: ABC transporter permease [Bacteriovoracaceae bacterium]